MLLSEIVYHAGTVFCLNMYSAQLTSASLIFVFCLHRGIFSWRYPVAFTTFEVVILLQDGMKNSLKTKTQN